MQPTILVVNTYYPEFLDELYAREQDLGDRPFEGQLRRVLDTAFGVSDAYSHGLRLCGWTAYDVICNADRMQAAWAREHGVSLHGNIHDMRRQVVAAQVAAYRPDVVFVFEWSPLGDAFLGEVADRVRLLVGQIASPLPANRTFGAYNLMVSSWPPIVEYFRGGGGDSDHFRLGFDHRVLDRLAGQVSEPTYDVTFVGGFAPSHPDRAAWLEALLEHVPVEVFGYGWEKAPPGGRLAERLQGPAWGHRMYEILRASRVTLNRHARIDVRGYVISNLANNMRLYEATGVGTCLVTDAKDNLGELFEPGKEIVTYRSTGECVEVIRHLLANDSVRTEIAGAGQRRTLREHRYVDRMPELSDILLKRL